MSEQMLRQIRVAVQQVDRDRDTVESEFLKAIQIEDVADRQATFIGIIGYLSAALTSVHFSLESMAIAYGERRTA